MGAGHPECPERLSAIEDRLLITGVADALERREPAPASVAELELAHGRMHIAALRGLSDELKEEIAAGGPAHAQLDPDTSLNVHTWEAALLSAGAALNATDAVIAGELENAFCATRPPGHHACRDKAMGFCFFNNVAVAAKYALERHHLRRVAIIDFDVHHGNGTQDVFYEDPNVFFFSTHQHPWYPGTGHANETGRGKGAGTTLNCPLPAGSGRTEILGAFETQLVPAMKTFRPELVLISAGFDSREGDPLGKFRLTDRDFADLTTTVREIAADSANGRVVSVLEGGYSLEGLAKGVLAHVQALE